MQAELRGMGLMDCCGIQSYGMGGSNYVNGMEFAVFLGIA